MPQWLIHDLAVVFAGIILGTAIGIRCSYGILLGSDEFVGKVTKRYFRMMEGARDPARAKTETEEARASCSDGVQPRGKGLVEPVGRVVRLDAEHIQRARDLRADDERECERKREREFRSECQSARFVPGTIPDSWLSPGNPRIRVP